MISSDALKSAVRLLVAAGLANGPQTAEAQFAWGMVLREVLPDWTDAALGAAVSGHIGSSERGRWWPTPADLVAAYNAATPSAASLDSLAWDTIVGRLSRYGRDGAKLRDHLGPEHLRALARIGGSWEVSRADAYHMRHLRKRFLAAADLDREHGTHLRLAGPAHRQLAEDAPDAITERTPVPAPRWRKPDQRLAPSAAAGFVAEVARRQRERRERGES